MKKRIWELDAARGFCIFCMLFVHLFYDLKGFRLIEVESNWLTKFFFNGWAGGFFFIISGISATLGSRSVKRGLIVMGCALLVSAVTIFIGMDIYFGVLHCLAVCMLLWPLFNKTPQWLLGAERAQKYRHLHTAVLGILGVSLVALGIWMQTLPRLDHSWLLALGRPGPARGTDYFPILPNLGYFLFGAMLGRIVYSKKESRFPNVSQRNVLVRFFCWLGTHSLPVYLIHQPVLFGLVYLLAILVR